MSSQDQEWSGYTPRKSRSIWWVLELVYPSNLYEGIFLITLPANSYENNVLLAG